MRLSEQIDIFEKYQIIMCDDMTAEATIAKLCYLFSKGFSN
jgi:hypothetical protein